MNSVKPLVSQGQRHSALHSRESCMVLSFLTRGKHNHVLEETGETNCEQECIFAEKQKDIYFLVVYGGAVTVLTETNDFVLGLAPFLKSPRKWKQTFLSANDSSSIKPLFCMHLPTLCLETSRVLVIPRMD